MKNETWLKEGDTKRINIPNYKYEGVPWLNKKGGGVGFLIRSDLQYRNRQDLEASEKTPSCEHCYIEIKNNKDSVLVGLCTDCPTPVSMISLRRLIVKWIK